MGRKKQNPEDSAKRGLILAAAGKMFLQQGYSAVSMDAIADAAPVSKPTLYTYFKDKKALFTAVMVERCRNVTEELAPSLADGRSAEDTLLAVARHFLRLILSPDALNMQKIALAEAQTLPEIGKLYYTLGPKRSTGILADYLARLDKDGLLSVPDPDLSAGFFLGMLKGSWHVQCALGLRKAIKPAEQERIAQAAVAMFLKGHARERAKR